MGPEDSGASALRESWSSVETQEQPEGDGSDEGHGKLGESGAGAGCGQGQLCAGEGLKSSLLSCNLHKKDIQILSTQVDEF